MSWVGVILSLFGMWQFVAPPEPRRSPTWGWGPFRSNWVSICSAHFNHDPNCRTCQAGSWRNVSWAFVDHCLFKVSPRAWRYLHNDVARWFNRWNQRRFTTLDG